MHFRSRWALSGSIGLALLMSFVGYRSLQASERIGLISYGSAHPALGDVVVIELPGRKGGRSLCRIDAGPGETVKVGDHFITVPMRYYYSTPSGGRSTWGFVPESLILGRVTIYLTNQT